MSGQQMGSVPGQIRTADHRIKRTPAPDAPEGTPTDAGDAGRTPATGIPCASDPAAVAGGQQVGSGIDADGWDPMAWALSHVRALPDLPVDLRGPDLRAQARDAALREAEERIAYWTPEDNPPVGFNAGYNAGMREAAAIIRRLREPTPDHQQASARGWE